MLCLNIFFLSYYNNMSKIIFATNNNSKILELKNIMNDFNMDILSMSEAGIKIDIEETGKTYEENALIKTRAINKLFKNDIIIADDSGLEIDYLNGEPGIYSARYLGHDTPQTVKNQKILKLLEGVKTDERTARFICCIAAFIPSIGEITTQGTLEGQIGYEEKGNNGFAYDKIFFLPNRNCYLAEISEEEKNKISHRASAIKKMKSKFIELGIL